MLIEFALSATGSLTAQTGYDAFGSATNAAFPTRYQFTGREFDSFTGLQFSRARFYDPRLGRFISEDPIGFAGGDVNLYGYVGNRPLALRDPTGQIPLLAPVIIGGGILILASPSYVNAPGPNDPVFDSRNDLVANGVIGSTLGLGLRVAGGAILSRFCQIGRPKKVTVPAQTASDLVPEFRPFTYRNFRYNLGQQTGQIPPNSHAHHVFPNEFADDFARAGLNHNDPSFGAWWQSGSHLRNAAQYNREWRNFLATDPNRDDIINFGRAIMTRYGISVGF
ncbi:MAG TPA: hypothetical protein DEP46_08455 [Blastocatellia bacterium]|nr:hypothetical protein [Blastocatellia bacterium]